MEIRGLHEEIYHDTSSAATSSIYTQCLSQSINISDDNLTTSSNTSSNEILQCVADSFESKILFQQQNYYSRSIFLMYAAALIFFMQAGFAMLCAGSVRKKNIQNTMLKNLLDACGAAIAFYCIGYGLAFGGDTDSDNNQSNIPSKTFMGTSNFFLLYFDDYAFWLFQYAFSAACTTIVAGALAERCQMVAYLCYSILLAGWVYPIIVHSIWSQHGFLSPYSRQPLWGTGVIDFAGASVVHVTGGLTALFATMILGPRRGRFHDDEGVALEVPHEFPGSSFALQVRDS
jgi:ammonium transporter, Amt family